MKLKPLVSIVTPCFNEAENIEQLTIEIRENMRKHEQLDYEHVIIDNFSQDGTRDILLGLAAKDSRIKLIFNTRNFGHIRSPVYGILQGRGDAVILMASDFQDPIFLIDEFLAGWQAGSKVVIAVKNGSKESPLFYLIRRMFYQLMNRISDVSLVQNYTGTGLYDRVVVEAIRSTNDPYPYFRGLIPEIGYTVKKVFFEQPLRRRGISKNNFFTLYDMAMAGIIGYSRLPMRIVTLIGFGASFLFFLVGVLYFVLKLIYWEEIRIGIAPIIIGFGFFASLQMLILGVIGEYVGYILTQVQKKPLVFEERRVNFDK